MTGIESIIKFLIKLGWPVVKVVKFLTTGVKRTVKKIKNIKLRLPKVKLPKIKPISFRLPKIKFKRKLKHKIQRPKKELKSKRKKMP